METGDFQELVSSLVNNGAHLDAVNKFGKTVYEICENEIVQVMLHSNGPVSLSCLAARCILKEGLPYVDIGLPPHIIRLVEFHDKSSFREHSW